MRRVTDITSPNLVTDDTNARLSTRSGRTIPTLLIPCENGEPLVDETRFAVTKNLSSQGASFVLQQPLDSEVVVVCFLQESECVFVRGQQCYRKPLEFGFWQIGIELLEMISFGEYESLQRLSELSKQLCLSS